MKKGKIAAYGEIMAKHTIKGVKSVDEINRNTKNNKKCEVISSYGGSEHNCLAALSALGVETRYATATGNDKLSKDVLSTIKQNNIDTKFCKALKNEKMGEYYFINEDGIERSKATKFFRQESAINHWDIKNFDFDNYFKDVRIFHVSGIAFSLDNEENGIAYKNGIKFLKEAQKRNIDISFDFNYRPSIWENKEGLKSKEKAIRKYKNILQPILKYVNIFLLSSKDIEKFLEIEVKLNNKMSMNSSDTLLDFKDAFLKKYPQTKLVVVRDREKDNNEINSVKCMLFNKDDMYVAKNILFPVEETIGGGDVFDAGVLYQVLKNGYGDLKNIIRCALELFIMKHKIAGDYIASNKQIKKILKDEEYEREVKYLNTGVWGW